MATYLKFLKTASGAKSVNIAGNHYPIEDAKLVKQLIAQKDAVECDKDGKVLEVKKATKVAKIKPLKSQNRGELIATAKACGAEHDDDAKNADIIAAIELAQE